MSDEQPLHIGVRASAGVGGGLRAAEPGDVGTGILVVSGSSRSAGAHRAGAGQRRPARPSTVREGHGPNGPTIPGSWAGANWSAPARMDSSGRVTAYPLREVWLIEVDGAYGDVADDVDHTIQIALAESPRGVVCSLTGSLSAAGETELDMLASAGRHVEAWPAIPVVLASRETFVPELLAGRPGAERLTHASSMLHGWTQVMTRRPTPTARLRLAPGAMASRKARGFLTRCALDWGLNQHLASGPLVVSELVTNAIQHAHTDIDVVLAAEGRRLRIAVRDRDPSPPVTRSTGPEALSGRGLRVVQTLARASGALPTVDGGKFVWAVLGP